jgi:peptidoglycan/LPS O-acetylase OafA/YrhL
LPLFLIGIISYHIYSRFAASDYKSSSTPGIPVAALIATALIVKWHPVALAAWAVGFGCIFVQGSDLFSKMLCAIRKLLLCRGLQHLGKVSYPLYVVHWPIILLLLAALLRCRPEISSRDAALFLLACGLPLILIAAGLLHRWIEMPFMALGKRLDRRSPRTESRVILPPTDIAAPAE